MSDTPKESWMNSDTLRGSAVSFVLSVGILNNRAAAARRLTFWNIMYELVNCNICRRASRFGVGTL